MKYKNINYSSTYHGNKKNMRGGHQNKDESNNWRIKTTMPTQNYGQQLISTTIVEVDQP